LAHKRTASTAVAEGDGVDFDTRFGIEAKCALRRAGGAAGAITASAIRALGHARRRAAASTGSLRRRLPVAAKIALVTAAGITEVPHSPIPPGGSRLATMCTSIAGAASMRSGR
jgi:hypothetical protein